MSSSSVNAFVSIHFSQPYKNIETHVGLKRRILRFSLGFGDLSIDLSLAIAAHARQMLSCSVEPTKDPRYLKSSSLLMVWSLIRWPTVERLAGLLSLNCSVFLTLISRLTLPASEYLITFWYEIITKKLKLFNFFYFKPFL